MPPAVGRAAAISASTSDRMLLKPPTMVQFAKAAFGPPVYITNLVDLSAHQGSCLQYVRERTGEDVPKKHGNSTDEIHARERRGP